MPTPLRVARSKKTNSRLRNRKSVEPIVPNALPNSRFDLSFALFVTCLKMLGVSLDKTGFLLKQDYGINVSSATLINTMNKLAGFLGTEYEKLRLELNREKSVHGDETGWKIKGRNNWLWEFVSKKIAYYPVESSRGKDVPKKVLDDFAGTLSSDFWNAYNSLDCEKQRCWTHLARELEKVMEDSPSKEFGKFSDEVMELFYWSWKERNHGHKTGINAENKLEKILIGKYRDKNCLRLVKRLRRHKYELFTFCSRKGLSPNNNHGEQYLRPSVVIRKTSYGSQSEKGAKTFATFMSFFQTSRLQKKNFHEYMQETIKNKRGFGKPRSICRSNPQFDNTSYNISRKLPDGGWKHFRGTTGLFFQNPQAIKLNGYNGDNAALRIFGGSRWRCQPQRDAYLRDSKRPY